MTDTIPRTALALGLGGLLPFLACAVAIWTGWCLPLVEDPARAMVAYGAVILSFLGGVRWGFALRMGDEGLQARALILSVCPSIAAWLLLLGPTLMALAALPMLILLLGLADLQLTQIGAPLWYGALRRWLTASVVLLLLIGIAGLVT
jgi:hypothetical protein